MKLSGVFFVIFFLTLSAFAVKTKSPKNNIINRKFFDVITPGVEVVVGHPGDMIKISMEWDYDSMDPAAKPVVYSDLNLSGQLHRKDCYHTDPDSDDDATDDVRCTFYILDIFEATGEGTITLKLMNPETNHADIVVSQKIKVLY